MLYSETCDERPPMRDQPVMGDCLLAAVFLFDIVKYTSDERPPLLKYHYLVTFRVDPHRKSYYTNFGIFSQISLCERKLWIERTISALKSILQEYKTHALAIRERNLPSYFYRLHSTKITLVTPSTKTNTFQISLLDFALQHLVNKQWTKWM